VGVDNAAEADPHGLIPSDLRKGNLTDLSVNRSMRLRSHPVIFCAWCGRVRVVGYWFGKPRELEVVAHAKRHTSTGICPSCFAELSPKVSEPAT
jgi:hypothetical protein